MSERKLFYGRLAFTTCAASAISTRTLSTGECWNGLGPMREVYGCPRSESILNRYATQLTALVDVR